MSIRVALFHQTVYRYPRLTALSPQVIRLRPAPHNRTPLHHYSLKIEPQGHFLNWLQDPHGNYEARVVFPEKTREFSVTIDLVADLAAYSPFDFFLEPSAEQFPFRYVPELAAELAPYLERGAVGPEFARFMEALDRTPRRTVDFLVDTNRALNQAVKYIIRMEPGVQAPEETLEKGQGSCRDSAWLMVHVLRQLGIAARFVSGYLIQLTADQKPVDGPTGPSADFTDLHAWCECYVPGAGWIGLDPTSGLFAAEGHIPLACTPKPSSAAPITGMVDLLPEEKAEFGFDMRVERVIDRPRVTKPYSEEQWKAVLDLGEVVDAELESGDVRLSTGGEPTFVSSEEPDAPEWNVAALGGRKEELADRLLHKLFALWGPGGFLMHGQGKWYPGEQLPRWAFSCYYLRDGRAVWRDPQRFGQSGRNYGHTAADAERFAQRLIVNLGLTSHGLMPAYEDVWYYLWRERRLPANVDVLDTRLSDPVERARLHRVFSQGLGEKVGFVLPLRHDGRHWASGNWFLRTEHCFLIPGDSPIGFRLPLDSIPWAAPGDYEQAIEADPFAARAPLTFSHEFPLPLGGPVAAPTELRQRRYHPSAESEVDADALGARGADRLRGGRGPGRGEGAFAASTAGRGPTWADPFSAPGLFESAAGLTRTALCVEPRGGLLRVFLPPLQNLELFLELLAALEFTSHELDLPIQLEGYPPPRDPRLCELKVTPDPGVIEVNVPPVRGWRAAVKQTEELYEAARQVHLVPEKFDVDGTHVGSGGGNHIVLGALEPAESPFLRRPDLLGSLVRFWLNHPALSYLFSGRFIGPTSQHPRVDEARNDSVAELELALTQLDRERGSTPPWLVDRVLRHILTDLTGNTHRTEFSIDKLYSPDGPTGRLGLAELRAFEMPPHERMSLVQQLLVRTLISTFWEKPYRHPLVRWGTRIHDDFMLPFYVEDDLRQLLDDLESRGKSFDPAWFTPHCEFRFPRHGVLTLDAMSLEVRGALEPWLVLGEEATAAGQARYVDSSLERLQVLTTGFIPERYDVVCNGVVVPMQATGTNGQFVAGVRYRAWQPPSCLHPTIGIHSPLHFDFYDRWNGRSVAGCTYHVVHPGGRAAEVRPVNAAAAESRRLARFEVRGHSVGNYAPRPYRPHPLSPRTLDLRMC
jgi:uncharacterized protein (DUF2126 family)/transglutaminase-like putative cysteine protease